MAGGMERHQLGRAYRKGLTLLKGLKGITGPLLSRQIEARPGLFGQLPGSRQVVGVDVSFKNMSDCPVMFLS